MNQTVTTNILIADDDPSHLMLAEASLAGAGFMVCGAPFVVVRCGLLGSCAPGHLARALPPSRSQERARWQRRTLGLALASALGAVSRHGATEVP